MISHVETHAEHDLSARRQHCSGAGCRTRRSHEADLSSESAVLCHCLQITVGEVRQAVASGEVRSLCDIRQQTGAGTGCTACHRRIRQFLEQETGRAACEPAYEAAGSVSPMLSAR